MEGVNEDKKVFDNTDDCCCRVTSDGGCTTLPEDGEENICLCSLIPQRALARLLMALAVVFRVTDHRCFACSTHAWSWQPPTRNALSNVEGALARPPGTHSRSQRWDAQYCLYTMAPLLARYDELLVFGHLLLWLGCAIGLMAPGCGLIIVRSGADEAKSIQSGLNYHGKKSHARRGRRTHLRRAGSRGNLYQQPPPPPARRWFSRAGPGLQLS